MNVLDYIEEYGPYSFYEKRFNEIDAAIFASLSYLDYKEVLINKFIRLKLETVGEFIVNSKTKREINSSIAAVKSSFKILDKIRTTKRFRNVKLYNYVYISSKNTQYCSMMADINEKDTVIIFEGTDELISGWYEDGELAYKFPVEAHTSAIKYVNKSISMFSKRQYTLVGHSKGGNLSLVAGMYARSLIQKKIKKIYSFDGPGLRDKEFNSRAYKNILDKYTLIIPNYSIVGLLFNYNDEYKVIESKVKGPYAHDLINWCINNNRFEKSELSSFSKKIDQVLKRWLGELTDVEKSQFFKDLFLVFDRANIKTLYDIRGMKAFNLFKVLGETKRIDSRSLEVIKDLIKSIKDEIKGEL